MLIVLILPLINALRSVHHELLHSMMPVSPLRTTVLDFGTFTDQIEAGKGLDLNIGMHPFRCLLPGTESSQCPAASKTGEKWVQNERRNFYTLSKIASFLGRCFTYKPTTSDVWSFSVCVGREIVRYRGARIMARSGSEMNHLGYHDPDLDEIFINGSMIQHYIGDTVSSSIRFECSESVAEIRAFDPDRLEFLLTSPHFCDWRSGSVSRPSLDRLLMDEVGLCYNLTADYWTYEYCHPDSLLQFHLERDDTVRTPMFLMGALRSTAASPAFPFIRSASPSARDAPALREKFRRLPLEIIKVPLGLLAGSAGQLWPREAGARGLALYLDQGSPCPEMPATVRSTRVIFICPADMAEHRNFRLVTVRETRTCLYDLLIETPHVCAHPQLRPPLPELPDTIRCFRRRNELEYTSDILGDLSMSPRSSYALKRYKELTARPLTRQERQEAKGEFVSSLNWLPMSAGVGAAEAKLSEPMPEVRADYETGRVSQIQLIEHLPVVVDAESEDFAMSRRVRNAGVEFKIGEVVHHPRFNYTGVVAGWDFTARVTEDWLLWAAGLWRLSSQREKRRLLREPWYLLDVPSPQVQNDVDFLQNWANQAYVPQPFLRRATVEEAKSLLERVAAGWRPSGFTSYTHLNDQLRFIPTHNIRDLYPFDAIPVIQTV